MKVKGATSTGIEEGEMIVIKKCYSWYNVYVNGTMILKHIGESDKADILKAAASSGELVEVRV